MKIHMELPAGRVAVSCHSVDIQASLTLGSREAHVQVYSQVSSVSLRKPVLPLTSGSGNLGKGCFKGWEARVCSDRPLGPGAGVSLGGRSCCLVHDLASLNSVSCGFLPPCPCRADCASEPPDQGGREQPCSVRRRPHHREAERAGPLRAAPGTL